MEKDAINGLATLLNSLPPWLAATVVLAVSAFGVMYLWRKSGEEAKREQAAKANSDAARVGIIIEMLEESRDTLGEIKTDIAILKDRRVR